MSHCTPISLHLALLRVVRIPICPVCSGGKDPGAPFCKSCYFALPKELRNLLYTRKDHAVGEFEEYYVKAIKDLKRRGLERSLSQWPEQAKLLFKATGIIEALGGLAA